MTNPNNLAISEIGFHVPIQNGGRGLIDASAEEQLTVYALIQEQMAPIADTRVTATSTSTLDISDPSWLSPQAHLATRNPEAFLCFRPWEGSFDATRLAARGLFELIRGEPAFRMTSQLIVPTICRSGRDRFLRLVLS